MAERWLEALANAADGVLIIDHQQRIIFCNQAGREIIGHKGKEIAGSFCYTILDGRTNGDRPICREHCAVAVTALGDGQVANFDMSVRARSGDRRWINMSTFVFPTIGRGAGPVVVHLFRNVTKKKENEQLLQKVLKAARELEEEHRPPSLPGAPAVHAGPELTDREREVLSLLVHGSSTDEMAQALVISTSTVRNHIRNIMGKFHVHSRLEAVMYALRNGLITLEGRADPGQQK